MTKMIRSLHRPVTNTAPKYNYILYITKGIPMLEQRQNIANTSFCTAINKHKRKTQIQLHLRFEYDEM
jgi:hypothetical protein